MVGFGVVATVSFFVVAASTGFFVVEATSGFLVAAVPAGFFEVAAAAGFFVVAASAGFWVVDTTAGLAVVASRRTLFSVAAAGAAASSFLTGAGVAVPAGTATVGFIVVAAGIPVALTSFPTDSFEEMASGEASFVSDESPSAGHDGAALIKSREPLTLGCLNETLPGRGRR